MFTLFLPSGDLFLYRYNNVTSLSILDELVAYAQVRGIVVMFDIHRLTDTSDITDLWYDRTGQFTTNDFACETMNQILDIIDVLINR